MGTSSAAHNEPNGLSYLSEGGCGQRSGASAGPAASGSATIRVRLSKGTYRYGSDRTGLSRRLPVR